MKKRLKIGTLLGVRIEAQLAILGWSVGVNPWGSQFTRHGSRSQ